MSTPIPILLYHSISRDATPQFRKFTVTPELFAIQMAYLHNHNYTPLTITELVETMRKGRLPERPVAITFDDGFADFHTDALPVLIKHNFVATLYIVTGYVEGTSRWLEHEGEGQRSMLTWSQIEEISTVGVECGAHSHWHPQLDVLPPAVLWHELQQSKHVLEEHLDREVVTFAYPYGYYNRQVRQMVQQVGYLSSCAVRHTMSTTTDDYFALARMLITSNTTMGDFADLLIGRRRFFVERLQMVVWRYIRHKLVRHAIKKR